jgi:hypothetical protein
MTTIAQFFYQPTMRQIVRGKTPYSRHFSKGDLVNVVEGLANKGYLEIRPDMNITRNYARTVNYAKKHGAVVHLGSPKSIVQAEEDTIAPCDARQEQFSALSAALKKSPDSFIHRVGYSWGGLGQNKFVRLSRLVNSIDGTRYYQFSEHHAQPDKKTKVKFYAGSDNSNFDGASYWCDILSRTEGKYLPGFLIKHVPVIKNKHKYSLAHRISTNHSCEDSSNMELFFADPKTGLKDVLVLDDHFVAAYIQIIDKAQKLWDKDCAQRARRDKQAVQRSACATMEMNVIALPTQEEMDFDNKLRTQVVTWDYRVKDGKVSTFRRPLNELEREVLHWNRVALRGWRKTFFPTQRLRDLNVSHYEV